MIKNAIENAHIILPDVALIPNFGVKNVNYNSAYIY